jgi:hypothetical protein
MAISDEHRKLLSRLIPVDMPPVPCHDCVPTVDGRNIEHTETCPLSIDIERVTSGDRQWFEDHPQATFYYRPVSWGEGAQLMLMDDRVRGFSHDLRLTAVGRVRVEQIKPGVRGRKFEDVYFIAQED